MELLQNGIGRTLGFLGRAGAMISITLLSRAEDEPEYQIHIDTGVSILLNGVAYTSSAEINDDMPYGVCEFDQKAAALLASGDAFRLERLSCSWFMVSVRMPSANRRATSHSTSTGRKP